MGYILKVPESIFSFKNKMLVMILQLVGKPKLKARFIKDVLSKSVYDEVKEQFVAEPDAMIWLSEEVYLRGIDAVMEEYMEKMQAFNI